MNQTWTIVLTTGLPLLLAGAGIAAPMVATWLEARKQAALARIVGMAGRVAASVGDALLSLPAGEDFATEKGRLIANGARAVEQEMSGSLTRLAPGEETAKALHFVGTAVSAVITASPVLASKQASVARIVPPAPVPVVQPEAAHA